LLVEDQNGKFLGTITDGNIRRFIISNGNQEDRVKSLYNRYSTFFYDDKFDKEEVKSQMISKGIEVNPVLNRELEVVRYET
jgi:hypothetical protein